MQDSGRPGGGMEGHMIKTEAAIKNGTLPDMVLKFVGAEVGKPML